jgi:transposase
MKKAPTIVLNDEEKAALIRWSHVRFTPARTVLRAKIVLGAAEGKQNKQIAAELGINPNTVVRWRGRFAEFRSAGIEKDAPRGGRIARLRRQWARKIIEATTQTKPPAATHWTTRTLAAHLGCDRNMVRRVWKANGLQPHRSRTFKVSNDPHFAEKAIDVVGLYLDPPEHALVLSVDEKSQIQALDRPNRDCR